MRRRRVLGIAAATGRVGYVLMRNGRPHLWGLSRKAAESPDDAARMANEWITRLRPEVVVTEEIAKRSRKGKKTRAIVAAIVDVAAKAELHDLSVPRPRRAKSKYADAKALAERFPELRPRLPNARKLWQTEPRNTTVFEALSLALVVIDGDVAPDATDQPAVGARPGER